jgi:hypothetical protein
VTIRAPVAAWQCAPQVGDVLLDHLRRAGRQRLVPQALDELVRRDRMVGAEREHGQHRTLLGRAERDGRPPVLASTGPSRRSSMTSSGAT